jgi:glutamine synthetase type III
MRNSPNTAAKTEMGIQFRKPMNLVGLAMRILIGRESWGSMELENYYFALLIDVTHQLIYYQDVERTKEALGIGFRQHHYVLHQT